MGPICPPKTLPVAVEIAGGLSPERTIFIDGGVREDAKWFDITLQCGPSLVEAEDIALRLIISFDKDYSSYITNSSISGQWEDPSARRKELILKGRKVDDATETKLNSESSFPCFATLLQTRNAEGSTPAPSNKSKVSVKANFNENKGMLRLIANEYVNEPSKHESYINLKTTLKSTMFLKSDQRLTDYSNENKNFEISRQASQQNLKAAYKFRNILNSDQNVKKSVKLKVNDHIEEPKRQNDYVDQKIALKSSISSKSDTVSDLNSSHSSISIEAVLSSSNNELTEFYTNPNDQSQTSLFESQYHPNFIKKFRIEESGKQLLENQSSVQNIVQKMNIDEYTNCKFSDKELSEIEIYPSEPFCLAFECQQNGFMVFLNGDLFCVYPHHFNYRLVRYIAFDGGIDLEQVEVGGGTGPDRTLIVDLYDEVVWADGVTVLTDDNFGELVLNSKELWIVDAYTAWCPACNKLRPIWESIATDLALPGMVKVGACNCDRNEQLTEDLCVEYFPMIFCFPEGEKSFKSRQVYSGLYLRSHIILWALKELQEGLPDSTLLLINHQRPDMKPITKTLRKKKVGIIQRKGLLTRTYGYVLRRAEECTELHETSGSKFFYQSKFTQTDADESEITGKRSIVPIKCSAL